jgi:putative DNA primase/helicase
VLRFHRGDFFAWDTTCYPGLDPQDVRSTGYHYLENASYTHPTKKGAVPFEPTRRKIDDVLDALRGTLLVESAVEAPVWLNASSAFLASEMISMANGLLHMPTRTLLPHSPSFFVHHALPFAFDVTASLPERWLRFLRQLWPDDPSSIATLQEAFGYLIGGGTNLQKIVLVAGRSAPARARSGVCSLVC